MKMKWFHPYHVVTYSPWPVIESIAVMALLVNFYTWFAGTNSDLAVCMSIVCVILTASLWWRDIVRESTFQGSHTKKVCNGLVVGFLMFILSETMLFFSLFFGYFSAALSPDLEVGYVWPPCGVQVVDWKLVPLGNTILLLSSGVSVTYAHYALLTGKAGMLSLGLMVTQILAIMFLYSQVNEYYCMTFTMSDSVFGSLFYLMTGFHGLHVLVGTLFLSVVWLRGLKLHYSSTHALSFEFASWYWHFVDVVWLFLFLVLYWWSC